MNTLDQQVIGSALLAVNPVYPSDQRFGICNETVLHEFYVYFINQYICIYESLR